MEVVVDFHEGGETSYVDENAEGDEWGAEVEAVGVVGHYEAEGEAGGGGGNGVELGFDDGVVESLDDRGGEVGEC